MLSCFQLPSIMVKVHGRSDVRCVTSAEAMSMNNLEMFSVVHVVPVLMDNFLALPKFESLLWLSLVTVDSCIVEALCLVVDPRINVCRAARQIAHRLVSSCRPL